MKIVKMWNKLGKDQESELLSFLGGMGDFCEYGEYEEGEWELGEPWIWICVEGDVGLSTVVVARNICVHLKFEKDLHLLSDQDSGNYLSLEFLTRMNSIFFCPGHG